MNAAERLAWIIGELSQVGLECLVMGGHAARYYGLDRTTIDFDLHVSPGGWNDLAERISRLDLGAGEAVVEGPSWRPQAFRRFRIGRLSDGREEWLEFWGKNHLLAPFSNLWARREIGDYGGRPLAFLSLADLIRSKETERATDWSDVSALEEFLDARLLAQVETGEGAAVEAMGQLRSRRGFERWLASGRLAVEEGVREALAAASQPITRAFLIPCAPRFQPSNWESGIEPVVEVKLRAIEPGTALHLTLVETVRRRYKLQAQADRADKQAARLVP